MTPQLIEGVFTGSQIIDHSERTGHKTEKRGEDKLGKNPTPKPIQPPHTHTLFLSEKAWKGNNCGSTVMVLSSEMGEQINLVDAPTNIAVFLLKGVCHTPDYWHSEVFGRNFKMFSVACGFFRLLTQKFGCSVLLQMYSQTSLYPFALFS